jgi:hypothetical protein
MVEIIIGLAIVAGSLLIGFTVGYKVRDRDYQHLLENYQTLIDRDPKTGRFVKSMRTLKND